MKNLLKKIGFLPKENQDEIFIKKYGSYSVEVDLKKSIFDYGGKIIFSESKKTIQNITNPEDWVVFECVNRLLEKGYKPEDIILEKVYPSGHGTSGRLDILVKKEGKAFLMIECKTWGTEFEKEFKKLQKDGGQLFTYFQQDRDAEYLVLYTSEFEKEIQYKNEIIKIEDAYRETSNVKDFYERWNKFTKQNGIFENDVIAYQVQSKAILNFVGKGGLKEINLEDSNFIFNQFLEILRHNVVSDKPNAFNKIFNLFLCKIIDEAKTLPNEPLKFQWFETAQMIKEINPKTGKKEERIYSVDDNITFQKRLTELYTLGMKEFLEKEVQAFGENKIRNKLGKKIDEQTKDEIIYDIVADILKKNNEFAIKEVFDEDSFEENAVVVKEIVKLLQEFQIRYPRKQQHLSDFFELLLTTGLKQESGQFFTPVPIARFIMKSIPLKEKIIEKLHKGSIKDLLPNVIDYATGSGHFLTESMEEIQKHIDEIDLNDFFGSTKDEIEAWKMKKFKWAMEHVYGVEKDYRLVKVAKVGCYFYGDGLANVIHGDGLANFGSDIYRGKLQNKKTTDQDNPCFDFVLSNPPYSVSAFASTLDEKLAKNDFDLYDRLTDQSSEIECLFIERTKQLLDVGGIAAIILPSSILSNSGIYTQTREIILKYFEIIAITELGSNTFMATGTNTVILFLRRRKNEVWQNINASLERFFLNLKESTVNGTEKVFSKYVNYVWEGLTFKDYKTLCEKNPNESVKNHEIFSEYSQKIKAKNEKELFEKIIEKEKDKLLYFILAFPQKIVLVKSGKKKEEKRFLGYEFSNRRGSEGIHPIQRGRSIDDCTSLFDPTTQENPEKASTYIFKGFNGDFDSEIDESLKDHVSRIDLVDMLTFDRVDFEKTVNLSVKKKIKIESRWELKKLGEICDLYQPKTITSQQIKESGIYKVFGANGIIGFYDKYNHENPEVAITCRGATCGTINFTEPFSWITGNAMVATPKDSKILKKYLQFLLETQNLSETITGTAQPQITRTTLSPFKIPLPPKEIQEKIVKETEVLKKAEGEMKEKVKEMKKSFSSLISNNAKEEKIENIAKMLKRGKSPKYGTSNIQIIKSGQARGFKKFDFSDKHFVSDTFILDERKLEKGDILINSSGVGTAGRVTLFDLDGIFVVDSHISILRLDEQKALPNYILYSLANIGFKEIEAMAKGQSGQIELSLTTIQNIKISLPTLPEQQKIVAEIEKIEIKIDALENKLSEIPNKKEAILKKYL